MTKDLYSILGVEKNASEQAIKNAYRKLARQYHPDRNPGDKEAERKFKEAREAYDVLSNKTKRAQYDQFGTVGDNGGFQGGGQTFHWDIPGGFGGGMGGGDAEDILSQLFGGGFSGRSRGHGPRGGPNGPFSSAPPDAEAAVSIPFEVAAAGGTVSVPVDGKHIEVKVPAGVSEGQKLRLKGQGPSGSNLSLKLHVEAHPYFKRDGDNIILEVPLSIAEAVLGAQIDVPTIGGSRLTVKVPPGASSGSRLRLRGKGIRNGDQFIEIKIVAPKNIDEKGRTMIEDFAKEYPQNPRDNLSWHK